MLTKSDIKIIKDLLKSEFSPLKKDVSGLKQDVSGLKQDVSVLKKDLSSVKEDLSSVKETVEFTKDAVINILDWTQDIHESIVMEKLPQRVKKMEQLLSSS